MAQSAQPPTATRHGNQPTKALGQLGYPSCGPRRGIECADSKFPPLPRPARSKTFKTEYYARRPLRKSKGTSSRNRPGVAQSVPGRLGSRIFMIFGTWWWSRHPHAPAAFTPCMLVVYDEKFLHIIIQYDDEIRV